MQPLAALPIGPEHVHIVPMHAWAALLLSCSVWRVLQARAALLTAAQCATYDEVKHLFIRNLGWEDGAGTHLTGRGWKAGRHVSGHGSATRHACWQSTLQGALVTVLACCLA